QSFEETSALMIRAMQTGSMGVLERMGLVVDQSTTTGDALAQMAAKLEYMKEPSFNFADSMTSVDKSFTEFEARIGKAIQNAPTFGEAFDGIAKSMFDFVKGFDYSIFTEWAEVGLQTLKILWDAFGETFDGIVSIFDTAFGQAGTTSAKQFVKGIVDGLFVIGETAAMTWNDIIGLFQTANIGDWLGELVVVITKAFSTIVLVAGESIAGVMEPIGTAIDEMFGLIQDLAATIPDLSSYLGFDPKNLDSARELGRSLSDIGTSASSMGRNIANAGNEFANSFTGINDTVENWKVNTDSLATKHGDILSAIDKIDYKPVANDLQAVKKASEDAFSMKNLNKLNARSKTIADSKQSAKATGSVFGPTMEEMTGNPAGNGRMINVVLEGADEFMNSFFEKFLNRAIEDAEAKGILVVQQ
ncbi:MAG TPA: hypothetical protein PKM25_15765, partial [Candidatus Ozemobacteraceae bacterium]|nr:hypothetical protein [Candidatus Ozemobacteraceae bacterium]